MKNTRKPSTQKNEVTQWESFISQDLLGKISNKVPEKSDDDCFGKTVPTSENSGNKEAVVDHGPVPKEIPSANPVKPRASGKLRKASFEEYRKLFLETPKIEDRKTVFISGILRDKLDEISRKLGDRKMSVSGFIENLARHHLDVYEEDLNTWKKL